MVNEESKEAEAIDANKETDLSSTTTKTDVDIEISKDDTNSIEEKGAQETSTSLPTTENEVAKNNGVEVSNNKDTTEKSVTEASVFEKDDETKEMSSNDSEEISVIRDSKPEELNDVTPEPEVSKDEQKGENIKEPKATESEVETNVAEKEKDEKPSSSATSKPPFATTTAAKSNKSRDSGFFSDPQPLAQQRLPLIAPLAPVTDSVDVPAYTCEEAKQLLKGKKIVYLGDSIQRASYKDLVLLLQENRFMTKQENRARAHRSILNDTLLDGGEFGQLTNDPHYKEVREFAKDGFHVKFFFITRIWYDYLNEVMKSIEELKPDVVIACSMLWDIMRYGDTFLIDVYKNNLDTFLTEIKKHVPETSAIIWANSPPVADRCYGGVFVKQVMNKKPFLKEWHLQAMKITKTLVEKHEVDMMDFLGYLYPYQSQLVKDGLHWSSAAHRYMTNIILRHVCDLWESEGAKLAEKAVTKLEDYKNIYDDPDDAYLADMQSLFDQQAVEAGHYAMEPRPYHDYQSSYAPQPGGHRHMLPTRDYRYDNQYHPAHRFHPEDPMLRGPPMHADPYYGYDPYGMPHARGPMPYGRSPIPPRVPRAMDYYAPHDPYYPYEGGYDDVYGGLPDSYLAPNYRLGAGFTNYPPRPAMGYRIPPPAAPGRWGDEYAMAERPFARSQYELARPLKRPMPLIEHQDPYAPVQKKALMESTATAASHSLTPAEAAKLSQTSTAAATASSSNGSANYQMTFEERYGGPVGKPMYW